MRKIFLIIFATFFIACSNDTNNEKIVGKWEYSTHFVDNSQFYYYQCERSKLQFLSNNSSTQTDFITGLNNNCEEFFTHNSEWIKNDKNEYTFGFIPYDNIPVIFETVIIKNDSLIINLTRSNDYWNFRNDKYIYLRKR